jgi:hypothetical protein
MVVVDSPFAEQLGYQAYGGPYLIDQAVVA